MKTKSSLRKTNNDYETYDNFDSDNNEAGIICSNEYIQQKINVVFRPIIAQMLIEQPKNPVKYMINWLERCQGEKQTCDLKKELINLRKKRNKYIKKKSKGYQSDDYRSYLSEEYYEENENEEEDDNESAKDYFDLVSLRNNVMSKSHRKSISAEAYGKFNLWINNLNIISEQPSMITDAKEQLKIIQSIAKKNMILSNLDNKDFELVYKAMKVNQYSIGDIVIKEGEEGNKFYVVQSGTLDCYKDSVLVTTYESGDSFGDLALLYNTPRQATIISKSTSILLSLDRESFTSIVQGKAIARKLRNEQLLFSIPLLQSFPKGKLSQLSEALKIKQYSIGEHILQQEDKGDKLYIVEEGEIYSTSNQIIKTYYPGNYLNEMALIKNFKSTENIIAKTNCSILSLKRKSFKRLLGSIENSQYLYS